ncbi:MAG: DUF3575 domain-containing protein [Muribaculaceae bacterium]|nr:DUF3575 domain-containing protein [Muribaculaceae bacterium]
MSYINIKKLLLLLGSLCSLVTIRALSINDKDVYPVIMEDPTVIKFYQPFDLNNATFIKSNELLEFSHTVDSIMRNDTITRVDIVGIASIDGPEALNEGLAKRRAEALEKWMRESTNVPGEIIDVSSRGEDWPLFRSLVMSDSLIPNQENVIRIIDSNASPANKEKQLKRLGNGKTWSYLLRSLLPKMRVTEVTLNVKHRFIIVEPVIEEVIIEEEVIMPEQPVVEEPVVEIPIEEVTVEPEDEWIRKFHIKTDLPYWLMTWANLGFEIDLAKHWSFNLPINLSTVNYFTRKIKFRNFTFQPGVRYWLKNTNKGVYFDAHYGMGWFNFAFNGRYRYQDHFRHTPTMGGGIGAGYRLPISKNGRWMMEFGGGVGVYRLNYDKFINQPNGKRIGHEKKTVFGIDNVNVSIGYSIPVGRQKGGGK